MKDFKLEFDIDELTLSELETLETLILARKNKLLRELSNLAVNNISFKCLTFYTIEENGTTISTSKKIAENNPTSKVWVTVYTSGLKPQLNYELTMLAKDSISAITRIKEITRRLLNGEIYLSPSLTNRVMINDRVEVFKSILRQASSIYKLGFTKTQFEPNDAIYDIVFSDHKGKFPDSKLYFHPSLKQITLEKVN